MYRRSAAIARVFETQKIVVKFQSCATWCNLWV